MNITCTEEMERQKLLSEKKVLEYIIQRDQEKLSEINRRLENFAPPTSDTLPMT